MISDVKSRTIYRLFDVRGSLLYIGISEDFDRRLAEHRKSQPWAAEIHHIHLISVTSTRRDGEVVEAALIVAERPIHNVTHNRHDPFAYPPTGDPFDPPVTPEVTRERERQRERGNRLILASVVRSAMTDSARIQDDDGWFQANSGSGPRALRKLVRLLSNMPLTEADKLIERRVGKRGKVSWRWKDEGVRDVLAPPA